MFGGINGLVGEADVLLTFGEFVVLFFSFLPAAERKKLKECVNILIALSTILN